MSHVCPTDSDITHSHTSNPFLCIWQTCNPGIPNTTSLCMPFCRLKVLPDPSPFTPLPHLGETNYRSVDTHLASLEVCPLPFALSAQHCVAKKWNTAKLHKAKLTTCTGTNTHTHNHTQTHTHTWRTQHTHAPLAQHTTRLCVCTGCACIHWWSDPRP